MSKCVAPSKQNIIYNCPTIYFLTVWRTNERNTAERKIRELRKGERNADDDVNTAFFSLKNYFQHPLSTSSKLFPFLLYHIVRHCYKAMEAILGIYVPDDFLQAMKKTARRGNMHLIETKFCFSRFCIGSRPNTPKSAWSFQKSSLTLSQISLPLSFSLFKLL